MPAVLSRFGSHRWIALLILVGLIAPLGLAALPGAPVLVFTRQPSQAQIQAAAVNAIRVDFLQARLAERDAVSGQPTPVHEKAISRIRAAIDAMGTGGGANQLRLAVDNYAAASRGHAGTATDSRSATASLDAIDRVLGQLGASDEAMLREPLLGVRLAGEAHESRASAVDLDRWAEVFSARLAEVAIPDGARTILAAKLAEYQRAVIGPSGASPTAPPDVPRAVLAVETALADLDRRQEPDPVSDTVKVRVLGAVFLAAVLLAGFAVGRAASSDRGPGPGWRSQRT